MTLPVIDWNIVPQRLNQRIVGRVGAYIKKGLSRGPLKSEIHGEMYKKMALPRRIELRLQG